jgi:1-pyrroline-5-carboxylate dehydrogenase
MEFGSYHVPCPENEKVLGYKPGSDERKQLREAIEKARSIQKEIPMVIGGEEIVTERKIFISPPHDHQHILGYFYEGDAEHVEQAINAALSARETWRKMPWHQRAAVFLKAADLISGPYRAKINAATMLGQSKSVYQAEIDSACELIDFLRFNVHYMRQIYDDQPSSGAGTWNKMDYRPLEGFVYALTPFNFTAIAGNLPTAPAIMGNTVVWKPAYSQIYSARVMMEVFREAGLPDGVINLIFVDGPKAGQIVFSHPEFAGIHFTGSTHVFKTIWKEIASNIDRYKSYPRIVGETGGKDFVVAHYTAGVEELTSALIRGAFEYQGQKCSAVSRAYISSSLWTKLKPALISKIQEIKPGPVEDFSSFFNAVIDEKAFDKIVSYIESAKKEPLVEILAGGKYDKSKGYFIEPTILISQDPMYITMCEEVFGPVLTIFVYEDQYFEEVLELIDSTSPYALTGAIFARDRFAIDMALEKLMNAAGNFYINDKPTGAIVGQQPFGGARASGTNDKAGSVLNLLRWVSPRVVKETFIPPRNYEYDHMG